MDPNTALQNAQKAVVEYHEALDSDVEDAAWAESRALAILAEAFEALDQWLSKGGFLPDEWDAAQRADQIIRIIFTTSDIEQMAEDAGVDPALAVQRATEWGRHITDTAAQLCDEQLQSCIENDTP